VAENIVDQSERALAQVSAALESAGAVPPSVGVAAPGATRSTAANNAMESTQDGPQKKKVCLMVPLAPVSRSLMPHCRDVSRNLHKDVHARCAGEIIVQNGEGFVFLQYLSTARLTFMLPTGTCWSKDPL